MLRARCQVLQALHGSADTRKDQRFVTLGSDIDAAIEHLLNARRIHLELDEAHEAHEVTILTVSATAKASGKAASKERMEWSSQCFWPALAHFTAGRDGCRAAMAT